MQDPNTDTEWNDILRAKGILPPKQESEITEDDIVNIMEQTIQQKADGKQMGDMNLKELDDMEDEIDEEEERLFEEYRRKRLQEMMAAQKNAKYGEVREITKQDWVEQVNKAGDGVWVIIHVFKQSIPLCKLINQHLYNLARKFPETKFLKSESSLCIPNYPDKNLPTVFVYLEGDMKKQFVGPLMFGGMNLTQDELEWMLSETGAIKTELEENPRKQIKDAMMSSLRSTAADSDDDNDW